MDTTPEYIKMCEKAEEIQSIRCGGIWGGDDVSFIDGMVKYGWISPPNIRSTWLPRQDQLQEIIYDNSGAADLRTLQNLSNFFMWLRPELFSDTGYKYDSERFLYTANFRSQEQLWLAFVMKEKYGKTWNGEEWVTND